MKYPLLSLLAMSVNLFANDHNIDKSNANAVKKPYDKARFGTKDSTNFIIEGEVIWFKPLSQELASQNTTSTQNTNTYFQNTFQAGERLSLGYNTAYDTWDVFLTYTGFNYHHSNHANYLTQTSSNNQTGKLSYSYYFNQGDLDFGRMIKISKKFKIRPHIGARVLWLTEKSKQTYSQSTSNYTTTQKISGTLGGLEGGFKSYITFVKDFCFYTNLNASTLVNQQKASLVNTNTTSHTQIFQSTSDYSSKVILGYDFAFGVQWDKNFSDDEYHINLHFGYEQYGLINLQSPKLLEDLQNGFTNSYVGGFSDPDFTYQGIVFGLRFDF